MAAGRGMRGESWMALGAVLMGVGVLLGAFGAHGLRGDLSERMMEAYRTAVFYHMIHALGVLLLGQLIAARPRPLLQGVALLMVGGILLFSGSLYLLAVTGMTALVWLTPIGGIVWVCAWFGLAAVLLRKKSPARAKDSL